jgi:hypothetical protein
MGATQQARPDGQVAEMARALGSLELAPTGPRAEELLGVAVARVTECWTLLGLHTECWTIPDFDRRPTGREAEFLLLPDMDASAHALVAVLVLFFALFSGAEVADSLRNTTAGGLAVVAEALLLSPLFAKAANSQLGAHALATAVALSDQVEAFNNKFTDITAQSATQSDVMRGRGTAAVLDTLVDSFPSSFTPSLRWFDLAGVSHLVSTADAHLYELPALLAALGSSTFGVDEVRASTQVAVAALETAVRALIEASCGEKFFDS